MISSPFPIKIPPPRPTQTLAVHTHNRQTSSIAASNVTTTLVAGGPPTSLHPYRYLSSARSLPPHSSRRPRPDPPPRAHSQELHRGPQLMIFL